MTFEGWVPNATGNLSFSAIGDSLSRGVLANESFWQPYERWLVCCQIRVNPDRQLPQPIIRLLSLSSPGSATTNKLHFVLTAKSAPIGADREGALDGEIAILSPNATPNGTCLATVTAMAAELSVASKAFRAGNQIVHPSQQWVANQVAIQQAAAFVCSFRMLRNGKIFVSPKNLPQNISPEVVSWLSSQCYYYLKDAVHHHYHHNSKTDAIIELTDTTLGQDWRAKTQRNLYRKVISLRRSMNSRRLSNAVGILSYAKVFSGLFGSSDFDYNGNKVAASDLPIYVEELRTSIEVRKDVVSGANASRKNEAQFIIGSTLAVIALYVSMYGDFLDKSNAKFFGEFLLKSISKNPYVLIAPVLVGLPAYLFYTNERDVSDIAFIRWLYRVTAWVRRGIIVAIGYILFFILIAISAAIFWYLFKK